MTEYLKSKFLPEPVVYVQEDTEWRSYAPGGSVTQSAGRIPASMLAGLEPVDPFEAQGLIERRLADAAEAQLQAGQPERESGSSRTVNLALRYLGILVPFPVSLGLFFSSGVPWPLTMVVSLTVWLAFTVALLVRRDWQGALAITVFYIFLNWWIIVFTALHITPD